MGKLSRLLLAGFALGSISIQSHAEGYYGYGWGWGWGYGMYNGTGATVQGSALAGAGYFLQGAGQFRLDTARARAINVDTWITLNEYLYQSQRVRNKNYWAKQKAKKAASKARARAEQDRILTHPTAYDIRTGSALNRRIRLIEASDLAGLEDKLNADVLANLRVSLVSEGIGSVSVNELAGDLIWPFALASRNWNTARDNVRGLLANSYKLAGKGEFTPEDLQTLNDMIEKIRTDYLATKPKGGVQFAEVFNFLDALKRLGSAYKSARFMTALASVSSTATVGELVTALNAAGLTIGSADTPAQFVANQVVFASLKNAPLPEGAVTPAPAPEKEPQAEGPSEENGEK